MKLDAYELLTLLCPHCGAELARLDTLQLTETPQRVACVTPGCCRQHEVLSLPLLRRVTEP